MDVNTVIIREIESKDYVPVAEIWRTVFDSCPVDMVVKNCEKMQEDDRYHTFVADVDGEVVGLVTTVEVLSLNMPNGYIKVNGLGVLPEYQHGGIGKMLMERVEKLAAERNLSLVGLASGFQRTNAHEFYEHLGYQKLSFWFRKRI